MVMAAVAVAVAVVVVAGAGAGAVVDAMAVLAVASRKTCPVWGRRREEVHMV